jgi:hypothetical protein
MILFIGTLVMAFMKPGDEVGIVIIVLMARSWNETFVDSRSTGSICLVERVLKTATGEGHRRLLG